jgi:serine/threonine protein kinase/Skp family chaperone for outer membrane proteins
MDELDLGQTVRGFASGQKVFARYVLQSILGRGGMGVVWRAFDEHLERDVALKFLPEMIMHDRAVLDDLKRETKRNLDLTHHHIVRIYDFAQDSQCACISMEYVDGETLSALRVDRPEKVFQAQELSQPMAELCEALTYAHVRASIVHRDLKPANLMLNSKGSLKVTDFGIARSLSDSISMLTMNRGVSGTLLYMSPQQLDGERASTLDDIYSVGATVYELLTSKPPFYSGGVERQIHEKVPPPMSARRSDLGIVSEVAIPEAWERTVAACLAKDPAQRPQSAADVAECFRGIPAAPSATTAAAPSIAIPPPDPAPAVITPLARLPVPSGESQPSGRPKKGLLYAGVVAGAVILIGGIAIYFSTRSKDETTRPQSLTAAAARAETAHPQASISPLVSAPLTREEPVSNVTDSTPSAESSPAETATANHSVPFSSSDGYDAGIALVDMQRIFKEYNKTKDAEAKVNDAKNAAKGEFDARTEVYKKRLGEINTLNAQLDSSSLSATAKTAKATERDDKIAKIKELEKEINDFRATREKQLQEQAMRMRTGIVNEITREIASLDTASPSIVYDRSGLSLNYVPLLLFAPERADMSNKVLSALNQKSRTPFTGAHDLSFGAVDMNRIFKAYNKTKDSEAKVNDAKNAAKKEFDDRAESYKKALDGINRLNTRIDSPSLTAATKSALAKERDEKIANIKTMEKEINEFRQTREQQLQQQAISLREGIVKEITDMIGKGIEKTSSILIDVSGTSTNSVPITVFVSGVPDFSAEVIAALNATDASAAVKFHAPLAAAKSLRFGVIDMDRAFKLWPETKSAEAKVNDAKEAARKQYDDRTEQYKKDLAEINSLNQQLDSPSLGADARSAKAKERDAKIASIKTSEKENSEFKTAREKQLEEQARKMREGIVAKITAALKATASEEHFNLVFDSSGLSANQVPVTVLVRGIPDLTEKVLKR